jgi:hypothetical protein
MYPHLTDHSFTYITLSEEENRSKNCKVNRPLYTISPRYSVLPIEQSSQLDWRWHSSWRICECPFASVTKACYIDIVSSREYTSSLTAQAFLHACVAISSCKVKPRSNDDESCMTLARVLTANTHRLVYQLSSTLNWFKVRWKLTTVFATHAVLSNELEQFMHKSVKQF